MPRGGRLTVSTKNVVIDEKTAVAHSGAKAGDYVALAVADTGKGMDAETRRRIPEPFFSTKGPGKGTGLGLVVVYGIVHRSGGFIDVSSELGAGTTFRVYLPRASEGLARC
jgi:signal transduction histidine kinase